MEIRTVDGTFESRSYIANPSQQWGSTAPLANGQQGVISSGISVSPETALQLAAVWGSVAIISDSIALLPIQQWKIGKSGDPVRMDPAQIIEQPWAPWPEFSMRDFITQGSMSYLLAGNVYGSILAADELEYPTQVQLISPNRVKVRRDPASLSIVTSFGGVAQDPSTVTRSMGLSFPGEVIGLNPISYMRNVLGVARAQDLYGGAFFANSARPDGVINVPGDLEPEEAVAMKNSWLEAHQGISASHIPAVLTGGATFQPVTMQLADVQFLEQMQYSASVISGMIYRIPPHMIGMTDKSTSWGSGIEQQELGFVRNTLGIWLARWEDWLTSWLPRGQFVTFDLSKRLRGDTLQRWAAYQVARAIGAMNNAEIREAEGMPSVDGPEGAALDNFAQPFNSSPMPAMPAQGGDKAN